MRLGLDLNRRRLSWLPAALFRSAEAGAWFDASDLPTLFQDSVGTTPVTAAADPVGLALDKSGNGNHASQAAAASKPVYGIMPATGVRNLLTYTEDFSNAAWSKVNAATGVSDKLIATTATGQHRYDRTTTISAAAHTLSVEAKPDGYNHLFLRIGLVGTTFNLATGAFSDGAGSVGSIVLLADGYYRCSVRITAAGSDTCRMNVEQTFGATDFTGDGTSGLFLRNAQLELGSTVTTYQKVVTVNEVTEAGIRNLYYLANVSSDSLPATLPDLGTNATIWYATEAGVTITGGQTIGAGAFETLRGAKTFAVGAINRALTAAETARMTRYLNRLGGV